MGEGMGLQCKVAAVLAAGVAVVRGLVVVGPLYGVD